MDITKLKVGDTVWVDTPHTFFDPSRLQKKSGKLKLIDENNLVIRMDSTNRLIIVSMDDLTSPPTKEEIEEITLRNTVRELYNLDDRESYTTKLYELGYKLVKKE